MKILPTKISAMKDSDSVFFIDLYVLHLISGDLHFAACDEPINFYSPGTTTVVTYSAQPIERDVLKATVDNKVDTTKITISNATEEFTSALLQSFDFRGSDVEIIQIAYPDSLTDPTAYRYVFLGYIDAPSIDMGKATFEAQLKVKIPNLESNRTVGKPCNAWFGDAEECGVTQVVGSGTCEPNSTQNIIYYYGFTGSTYWLNGVITIGYESKKIISQGDGWVQVEYPFFSSPTNHYFTIVTGCDKTQTDCKRWNNLSNYSGFPSINTEFLIKT